MNFTAESDRTLIDRIYECAFAPDLWPGVLDELARIADAHGGFLFAANEKVLNWTASEQMRGNVQRFVNGDWLTRGQRMRRLVGARHAGFLTEYDLYTEAELAADPIYRDLMWPAGFGWGVATAVPLPTGDMVCLSIERTRERGPVEQEVVRQLDILRPHLARGALLSARLQLERARAASETLALIGLPALVMDDHGKVLAANHLIEALTGHVHWRANDRVSLKDRAADALFQQALITFGLDTGAPVRSFALRGADPDAAMVAHAVPIRGTARDIFVRCAGILVLTPVALPNAPPVELIQSLFDLSPAEARVARHLATGSTVGEIASADGVSTNTVRTQVRGVLEKTGLRRQTEVVALLGGVALPRV
jgi:DNA-binding CsgD family transcriptional regulator